MNYISSTIAVQAHVTVKMAQWKRRGRACLKACRKFGSANTKNIGSRAICRTNRTAVISSSHATRTSSKLTHSKTVYNALTGVHEMVTLIVKRVRITKPRDDFRPIATRADNAGAYGRIGQPVPLLGNGGVPFWPYTSSHGVTTIAGKPALLTNSIGNGPTFIERRRFHQIIGWASHICQLPRS